MENYYKEFPAFSDKRRSLRAKWGKTKGISWEQFLKKSIDQMLN